MLRQSVRGLLACVIATLLTSTAASALPFRDFTPRATKLSAEQVGKELMPSLSTSAAVYTAGDPRWANATARWQTWNYPNVYLVIEPGSEADVPKIVKYANSYNVPFYTRNTGHGSTKTLGKFNGIQISLTQLRGITIQPDKKTAILQGGVYGKQVIEYMWGQGYITGTGSCGCVSLLGPGLGGGHGRMQGRHGLILDHFVKLNVVLADGSTTTVSESSNPDLFWGMRGAGHNFGIVTSFEHKIYPRDGDLWFSKIYTFNSTKLEKFHTLLNELAKKQIPEIINWSLYLVDPSVSTTDPVIHWAFEYIGGTAELAAPYLKPFEDLGPINSSQWLRVPMLRGPLCEKGDQRMQMNAGLKLYNVTAQRQVFELFKKNIFYDPAILGSVIVMEGYSLQGVLAVDPASTAYALRDDDLLVAAIIRYHPNSKLDDFAIKWASQTRDIWNKGQPSRKLTTYTNYGFGDESLESQYGYEPWRLTKLRALKKKFDPSNKFGYYNGIQ
ncbi:hypothetical protein N0V90_006383 [Kalmusia sp. IMI 367209]|nr:hypothetical protein N0V90_006383 [Kalmusia sp. IMI 367209]